MHQRRINGDQILLALDPPAHGFPDHSARVAGSTLMLIMIVRRSTKTLLASNPASRSATLTTIKSPLTE
jgi:hypothetical protein